MSYGLERKVLGAGMKMDQGHCVCFECYPIPSPVERTVKVPLPSVRSIVSEPIKGHEQYHIMVCVFVCMRVGAWAHVSLCGCGVCVGRLWLGGCVCLE